MYFLNALNHYYQSQNILQNLQKYYLKTLQFIKFTENKNSYMSNIKSNIKLKFDKFIIKTKQQQQQEIINGVLLLQALRTLFHIEGAQIFQKWATSRPFQAT